MAAKSGSGSDEMGWDRRYLFSTAAGERERASAAVGERERACACGACVSSIFDEHPLTRRPAVTKGRKGTEQI
jgi:hypothetical protein